MSRKQLPCSPEASSFNSQYSDKEEERRSKMLVEQLKSLSSEADLAAVKSLFLFARAALAGNSSSASIGHFSGYRNIFREEYFDTYLCISIDWRLLHESEFKKFLLTDPLDNDDLDETHLSAFYDSSFVGKVGKYLGAADIEQSAKVIGFCLDLESPLI
jgi:hypothetical protein